MTGWEFGGVDRVVVAPGRAGAAGDRAKTGPRGARELVRLHAVRAAGARGSGTKRRHVRRNVPHPPAATPTALRGEVDGQCSFARLSCVRGIDALTAVGLCTGRSDG